MDQNLFAYNQLVLKHQEEAYNLAFYLLGDENAAEEATQEVFLKAFHAKQGSGVSFRIHLLQQLIRICSQRRPSMNGKSGGAGLHLEHLSSGARLAVVLVDMLGLDYPTAAAVAGLTSQKIKSLLVQGRISLFAEVGTLPAGVKA